MQLYRQMSIVTAKPTPAEQGEIPHHLIDLIEPGESFSVARYTELARQTIAELAERGKLPVVAGGTGLYIRSLLSNITFAPQGQDLAYREELRELAANQGNGTVHTLLQKVDPVAAQAIHPNNLGRVIRALEVYRLTGDTITQAQAQSRSQPTPYRVCSLGIGYRDKQRLDERIDRRVDLMLQEGLIEEARALWGMELSPTASQAIGYKELVPFFQGELSLGQAVDTIKLHSRQYAKRQMTWFRREQDIRWLWAEDYDSPAQLSAAAVALARETLGLSE